MAAYQHRPARREHVFVAPSASKREEADDPVRTVLVLDALHKLSPRRRAVLVLRHWDGFGVDETADMLGLADARVEAYEAAGLAALDDLLATGEPGADRGARVAEVFGGEPPLGDGVDAVYRRAEVIRRRRLRAVVGAGVAAVVAIAA